MHRTFLLFTAAAFGMAQPALAQGVAAQAPVPAGTAAAARALADPDVITVRNVTRPELVAGLPIVESDGATIGTVSHLAGNDVILTDGQAAYRVPITDLYAYAQEGIDRFASRTPKSALEPDTELARQGQD